MDVFALRAHLKDHEVDYCKSGICLKTKSGGEIIIPSISTGKKNQNQKALGFNWFLLCAVGADNFELCLIEKIMQHLSLLFFVFFFILISLYTQTKL